MSWACSAEVRAPVSIFALHPQAGPDQEGQSILPPNVILAMSTHSGTLNDPRRLAGRPRLLSHDTASKWHKSRGLRGAPRGFRAGYSAVFAGPSHDSRAVIGHMLHDCACSLVTSLIAAVMKKIIV